MLDTVWTYATHQRVHNFLVDGDDCFVAGRNTRLVALNGATGEPRWSIAVKNAWGWLAATRDYVFYLNQHSELVALNRLTGEMIWSRNLCGIYGWLHAYGQTVVVGGWRGYTDVLAMDATDGRNRWGLPAKQEHLHSTRIHAQSNSLVVASPADGGSFIFMDLDTGRELSRHPAPGDWVGETCGRPRGTSLPGTPLVLDGGVDGFFVVDGTSPTVERIAIPDGIWSHNLTCAGRVIPFVTPSGDLAVWSFQERRARVLGRIEHNRRDLLPFCQISEDLFLAGTSFGTLNLFGRHPIATAAWKVGKRISTTLSICGPLVVFGTDSGSVLGVKISSES